ncbi:MULTISPECIES: adenylate/guanylate cyclase domain-containing protein [unclassified Deinococcus]|uniref:adenylate/guanylate cyclase domain-containing protein n=1 Tax=unclassified Deinococcus TaxID=2623546 RepID=UPI000992B1E4|nr:MULTISPECIES: adenylate/guanylate cyclase domain-containing protein [unclassified Deinococcus]MBX8465845.1 adenylate/guanylate cyclase domain-containing protein [Deinococcus sp. RIT780]MCD0162226.1 adenylate/guanylate cyclase domain-containing protein [Deinococcus sp. 6YEL10]OOV14276.1 adenylate/guanylate cyclase domain-containing protein [Deinococcus sp. LM3]PIG97288.1 adenylate/guanylate cyclase domain-containing protein [Deinococcus sp. UR1]
MADLLLPLPGAHDSTLACLVMVDLVGSTAMATALPLRNYQTLMQEFVQVMILSLEARGGQVLQHQGDAVLAWWPLEQASAACVAAAEAHDRAARLTLAAQLGQRLRLRAGVSGGEVIMGVVGGQNSAYGLPVNYATRLCGAAEPGQTLLCDSVLGYARELPTRPYQPLHLRGFGDNCRAHLLRPLPAPGPRAADES